MTTDSDIIAASRESPGRFAEIFERHAPSVGAFATSRVGVELAEDVVGETFAIAFARRASYDGSRQEAKAWLFGIAVNVMAKFREKQFAHWRRTQRATAMTQKLSEPATDDVERRIDAEREYHSLMKQIEQLKPRDREILLLFVWEELSYEDIASALGIPIGTVRSRLSRVRATLAKFRARQPATSTRQGSL